MKLFSKSDLEFYLAINDLEKKIEILTLRKHTSTSEKFKAIGSKLAFYRFREWIWFSWPEVHACVCVWDVCVCVCVCVCEELPMLKFEMFHTKIQIPGFSRAYRSANTESLFSHATRGWHQVVATPFNQTRALQSLPFALTLVSAS